LIRALPDGHAYQWNIDLLGKCLIFLSLLVVLANGLSLSSNDAWCFPFLLNVFANGLPPPSSASGCFLFLQTLGLLSRLFMRLTHSLLSIDSRDFSVNRRWPRSRKRLRGALLGDAYASVSFKNVSQNLSTVVMLAQMQF
jgi:hypothetical protein